MLISAPSATATGNIQSNIGIESRRERDRRINLTKRPTQSRPKLRPVGETGTWPVLSPGTVKEPPYECNGYRRRWVFAANVPIRAVREHVVSEALSRLGIDHFYEALAYNRPGGGSVCFDFWCPATAGRPEVQIEVTTGSPQTVAKKWQRAREVERMWPGVVVLVTDSDALDRIAADYTTLLAMIQDAVMSAQPQLAATG